MGSTLTQGMQGVEAGNLPARSIVWDGVDVDLKPPGSRLVAPYSNGRRSLFSGDMGHSDGADLVDL